MQVLALELYKFENPLIAHVSTRQDVSLWYSIGAAYVTNIRLQASMPHVVERKEIILEHARPALSQITICHEVAC